MNFTHILGFLPTFGPSYLNMYGSPRELTVLNKCDYLDKGKICRHNVMKVLLHNIIVSDSVYKVHVLCLLRCTSQHP